MTSGDAPALSNAANGMEPAIAPKHEPKAIATCVDQDGNVIGTISPLYEGRFQEAVGREQEWVGCSISGIAADEACPACLHTPCPLHSTIAPPWTMEEYSGRRSPMNRSQRRAARHGR